MDPFPKLFGQSAVHFQQQICCAVPRDRGDIRADKYSSCSASKDVNIDYSSRGSRVLYDSSIIKDLKPKISNDYYAVKRNANCVNCF